VGATARAIEAMGRRALEVQADVADPEACARMADEVAAGLGAIDILVNSAGGPWKPQDVTEIAPEHLRRVLSTEIESVYALVRAVLPSMRARGWGRIISIGGHMADEWRFGPPEAPLDYPLGKAARHWITRTLAPRENARGITINAIAPGPTSRVSLEEAIAALSAPVASEGGNVPQHIADVVSYLCSDAAARVSGAVVPVPGARPV
jgi:3-oxoacyl-[acyl-carrier protein] reductase